VNNLPATAADLLRYDFATGLLLSPGESPAFRQDHVYRVVIDLGDGPPQPLVLGVADADFLDNFGEYQVIVRQLECADEFSCLPLEQFCAIYVVDDRCIIAQYEWGGFGEPWIETCFEYISGGTECEIIGTVGYENRSEYFTEVIDGYYDSVSGNRWPFPLVISGSIDLELECIRYFDGREPQCQEQGRETYYNYIEKSYEVGWWGRCTISGEPSKWMSTKIYGLYVDCDEQPSDYLVEYEEDFRVDYFEGGCAEVSFRRAIYAYSQPGPWTEIARVTYFGDFDDFEGSEDGCYYK
jgi:hypothetical protein